MDFTGLACVLVCIDIGVGTSACHNTIYSTIHRTGSIHRIWILKCLEKTVLISFFHIFSLPEALDRFCGFMIFRVLGFHAILPSLQFSGTFQGGSLNQLLQVEPALSALIVSEKSAYTHRLAPIPTIDSWNAYVCQALIDADDNNFNLFFCYRLIPFIKRVLKIEIFSFLTLLFVLLKTFIYFIFVYVCKYACVCRGCRCMYEPPLYDLIYYLI